MPSDGPDPNSTRADGSPDTSRDRSEEVALGGAGDGGTVAQDGPPSWLQKAAAASAGSAAVSRSGKAIYELDREIERHQTAGGEDLADGYTLLRKLGTGSFGTVWEAEDRLTHERVAIKFFTAGDSDWEKLLSEVGLLQAVEGCRGIVMVKQVRPGENGRRPLYVMQLANGGSLADWIKSAGTLPPRDRVRLATEFFTGIARAMAAVHRRGIHHCDIKPQNVLLHHPEPGAAAEPLVADFGQAHLATDDTPALGTYFFMPPDQIDAAQAGTPPDTRWDVYAMAAVAYEMITGEPPRRTAEFAEKIKKAPKNLVAKMTIYRDSIRAAPRPVAHHKFVDRALARIIDRCLSLHPGHRPRDAGALVALLDARMRWRNMRPVLALASVATLLVIALIAGAGVKAADEQTNNQKKYVTTEVHGSLARTAGYSAPAVERRLQARVRLVEDEAKADRAPQAVVAALTRLGHGPHGTRLDRTAVPATDRDAFANWLGDIIKNRQKQAGASADSIASVTLMLVADSDRPGASRGFVVARAHPNGDTEHAGRTDRPEVYERDFSFRDYFHGRGCRAGVEGTPHPVVRATHICNPYRSRGDDRTSKGELIPRPWKVDVVTPLWDAPGGRVVGLLSIGLNLENDIAALLYPVRLGERNERRVKVVLVDDRDNWVWHPDWCGDLTADTTGLPHDYRALATARGLDPAAALPWDRMDSRRLGYAESDEYVDVVEAEPGGPAPNSDPEIACFTQFQPYKDSRYPEARPRMWVLIAQTDRATALHPLDHLRAKIVRVGAIAGAALVVLALTLWLWLFRVLRRLEFASHG